MVVYMQVNNCKKTGTIVMLYNKIEFNIRNHELKHFYSIY